MHAHLQLDIQSVVAIAFDSTPRSAMVMSGKLMLDQDNNPICDVGNLPNPEIYSSVAWILRIFSP